MTPAKLGMGQSHRMVLNDTSEGSLMQSNFLFFKKRSSKKLQEMGAFYMERNSVVSEASVQSRTGGEAGTMLKARGLGSLRGCLVKGSVRTATQLKAFKSTEDRVWIIHEH